MNGDTMNKILKEVREYAIIIAIAFIVAIVLNTLFFSISNVKETSMEPTLVEGDTVIVGKLAYKFGKPDRGDIVVLISGNDTDMGYFAQVGRLLTDVFNKFRGIENPNRLVKRVIGLPGDTINIVDGTVYVNDIIMDGDYIDITTVTTDGRNLLNYPIVVPEGQVFVLGDHREVSKDSRSFGFVDIENIEGKVDFRIFPFNKFGGLK